MNMEIPQIPKDQYSSQVMQTQVILPKAVAIVGSGLVGRSWAVIFGRAGYDVNLYDADPEAARKAVPIIHALSEELHRVGLLKTCKSADELVSRIHVAPTLQDALHRVCWVQECVPENVDMKRKVFEDIDAVLTNKRTRKHNLEKNLEEEHLLSWELDHIILASSSSAIPASQFTNTLSPEVQRRCIVAHPVNPAHLIPFVEIVPTPHTSPEVPQEARQRLEEVGQKPAVMTCELPSFILNRLQGALLNEAMRLVGSGVVSPKDIDRAVSDGLGLRWAFMGPFATIDLNAPGGVSDYGARYGPTIGQLGHDQAEIQLELEKKGSGPWDPATVKIVSDDCRADIPLEQLPERAKWRDARLMALLLHKKHQEDVESQHLK